MDMQISGDPRQLEAVRAQPGRVLRADEDYCMSKGSSGGQRPRSHRQIWMDPRGRQDQPYFAECRATTRLRLARTHLRMFQRREGESACGRGWVSACRSGRLVRGMTNSAGSSRSRCSRFRDNA